MTELIVARSGFTIRPSEKVAKTITELSKRMGISKNKLVTGFIEEAHPHMEQMLQAMILIEDRNPEGLKKLSNTLKEVISDASEQQVDIVDLMVDKDAKK